MANLWPNPLEALGYQVIGVERGVTVSGQERDRTVVPDVICGSVDQQHVLCVDAKSRTIDGPQERAYMLMESSSLFGQGVVPTGVSLEHLTHDNILATSKQFCDTLIVRMGKELIELPVVTGDDEAFALGYGNLRQADLNKLFADGVSVTGYEWPTKFVKFTSRSTKAEIAPVVVRSLMEHIRRGAAFSVEEVIIRSIDHWHLVGQRERRALRTQVTLLLDEACTEELAPYFERLHPAQRWAVTTRVSNVPNALEALHKRARAFVQRKEYGIHFHQDQPPLFDGTLMEIDDDSDDE
ncbi:hypothetical protein BH23CHL1_BH23CHL1_09760 [soil metagenome]